MTVDDLVFELIKDRPATEKHPKVAIVKVSSETKTILSVTARKNKLVIFYEEKEDDN